MKNFNRTICAIFAFIVAIAMGACTPDPQGGDNSSVTFNVELVKPTPMGAEIAVTVQNVKEFAYLKRDTYIDPAPILEGGTKVTIANTAELTTKNITIQGLESNTLYTYQFACRAADNTIVKNVVKIEFMTTSYGEDVLTVVEQKYDGWSVFIQIPEDFSYDYLLRSHNSSGNILRLLADIIRRFEQIQFPFIICHDSASSDHHILHCLDDQLCIDFEEKDPERKRQSKSC